MVETNVILRWFSNELVSRMADKGVTYQQVAFASRSMPHNINGYIRGESFPSPWRIALIAGYLECTIDNLLGYDDNYFKYNSRIEKAFTRFPDEDSFTPYLRDRIIQRMKKMNMTEEDLIRKSGLSPQTIKRYLCVHSGAPQIPSLLRICDAFRCTPSELIGY